jgi:hypothetical protein
MALRKIHTDVRQMTSLEGCNYPPARPVVTQVMVLSLVPLATVSAPVLPTDRARSTSQVVPGWGLCVD